MFPHSTEENITMRAQPQQSEKTLQKGKEQKATACWSVTDWALSKLQTIHG